MKKGARELLESARFVLDQPEHWLQASFARDATGVATLPDSPHACSWCLLGVLDAASPQLSGGYGRPREPYNTALDVVRRVIARHYPAGDAVSVSLFNDMHAHKDVLKVLDTAIAELS
jgi:hypothetical protein